MLERFRMTEGWLTFGLLLAMLITVSVTVQAANWAPGLYLLHGITLLAFVTGYIFAKSRLSALLLHPLSLAGGLFWIFYLALGLIDPAPWPDRLAIIIIRLLKWGLALTGGGTSSDPLPFVLLMSAFMWLLAYGVSWDFYRARHIWIGMLISGVTVLINTYYAASDLTLLLIAYVLVAFLLVIRVSLSERERQWQRRNIFYSPEIQFDFLRDGALFAVVIVAFAWLTPNLLQVSDSNPLLTRISQPWGRAQQTWGRVFSSLNYRGTPSGAWFSRTMNFRGPLNRSDRLVMNVRSDKGRYWRAIVLDRYTSAGWVVSNDRLTDGPPPGDALPNLPDTAARAPVEQEYTLFSPAGPLLFAAGQPVQVSLDTQLLYAGPTADQELPPGDTISQLFADEALFQGQSYTAVSEVNEADVPGLRASGYDYPDYIRDHYTILPDTVPARVGELAASLTEGLDNPYDIARTLEIYLRAIPYEETIEGPRPGEDGVDYFLFRERAGYCDYYASSLAVMLRSLGIPARLAQGYNQGEFLPSGVYEVRGTNAHTWVEVYFNGYGWIEFEPTASEAEIFRPTGDSFTEDDALPAPDASNPLLDSPQEQEDQTPPEPEPTSPLGVLTGPVRALDVRLLLVPLGLLLVGAAVGATGWAIAQRRWRALRPIERIFDQLGIAGRLLGYRPDPTLTPSEYADRIGADVPTARPALGRLAALFSKQRFAGRALERDEEDEADRSWSAARRAIWQRLLARLRRER